MLTKHPRGPDKQRLPKIEADQATNIDLSELFPLGKEQSEPFCVTSGQGLLKQRVELENGEKPSSPSPTLHTGKSSVRRRCALNRAARVEPKPTSTPDVWHWISVCNAFLADFKFCYLFWSFKNLTLQSPLSICGEISFRSPSGCQNLQMLEYLIANCVVDSAL